MGLQGGPEPKNCGADSCFVAPKCFACPRCTFINTVRAREGRLRSGSFPRCEMCDHPYKASAEMHAQRARKRARCDAAPAHTTAGRPLESGAVTTALAPQGMRTSEGDMMVPRDGSTPAAVSAAAPTTQISATGCRNDQNGKSFQSAQEEKVYHHYCMSTSGSGRCFLFSPTGVDLHSSFHIEDAQEMSQQADAAASGG